MSRHGYSDDCYDILAIGRWRGQVANSIRGKRGQAFLRELIAALEAMTEKRLISGDLRSNGEVCALGAVVAARGVDLESLDVDDYEVLAGELEIASPLAQEIMWENDENGGPTPEERYQWILNWARTRIK
jgi:hypothetical protein